MTAESEITRDSKDEYVEDWEIAIKAEKPFVGIGWGWVGDLTLYSENDKERLIEKLKSRYEELEDGKYRYVFKNGDKHVCTERTFSSWVGYILSFVNRIELNDIIITPTYPEESDDIIYFIGRVKSPAYYVKKSQDGAYVRNRRDVEWLTKVPRERISLQLKKSLESKGTVYNIDKHEEEIQALLKGERFESKPIIIERKRDYIGKLSEIQKRLMDISPSDFEELVCAILSLKYDVKAVKTRDVADGGIDFVCIDELGDTIYRGQVKRVSKSIGNIEILQLRGALRENQEGIFVTTSHFTTSAKEEANSVGKKRIHTISGELLSQFILDFYDELEEKFKNILKIEK